MKHTGIGLLVLLAVAAAASAQPAAPRTPREALRAFNELVGERATGTPEGSREQRQRGFWREGMAWQWQFKGADAWLRVAFAKGKHFTAGELRYLPKDDLYQLTLTTPAKDKLVFTGPLREHVLTLEREDAAAKQTQRLVFTFLHANRFLYRYEVKPADRPAFARRYLVAATKEGVPFASGDGSPECIVSGGRGTMAVTFKGQTYYVCCTGCRDAFNDEPEKYIKEAQAKRAARDKGK
jgi:YHS domain-containing protein